MKKFKFLIFLFLGFILFAKSSVVYASRSIPVIIHGVSTGVNVKLDNNNPVLVQPETIKFFNDLGDGSNHTVSVATPQGYSVRFTICSFDPASLSYKNCPSNGSSGTLGSSIQVSLNVSKRIDWWFEPTSSSDPAPASACDVKVRIEGPNSGNNPTSWTIGQNVYFQGWKRFCASPLGKDANGSVDLYICSTNDLSRCSPKISSPEIFNRDWDQAGIEANTGCGTGPRPNNYGWRSSFTVPSNLTAGTYYLNAVAIADSTTDKSAAGDCRSLASTRITIAAAPNCDQGETCSAWTPGTDLTCVLAQTRTCTKSTLSTGGVCAPVASPQSQTANTCVTTAHTGYSCSITNVCVPPCDFSQNGNYTDAEADIAFWRNIYAGSDTDAGRFARADCSLDTKVDLVDLNRWRNMKYLGNIGVD